MKPVGYNILLLTPFLLLLQYCANAQSVVFTATAGAQKISLTEPVEVTYTIHNAPNLVSMGPTSLKDFALVAGPFQSSSSNTRIVNGRASQMMSVSLVYVLQPTHAGKLSIPAAMATDASGNKYQSNALSVTVIPGRVAHSAPLQQPGNQSIAVQAQPQQAQNDFSNDLFLRAAIEKNKVHVGEQVTLKWKLYHRVSLHIDNFQPPALNGAYTQNFDSIGQDAEQRETVNGRQYTVHVIKKMAIFPQQPGKLQIDPAVLAASVRVKDGNDNSPFSDPVFQQAMGGMMDPFMDGFQDVPVTIKSLPLSIDVQPLAQAGQPSGYTGAVGSFKVISSLDKNDITTNDIATYTLRIEGKGNFKLFTAPRLVLPKGLSSYDPQTSDSITGTADAIAGAKTIVYSISPQQAGDLSIPAQTFTFFNPESGAYEVAKTPVYTIHIRQGKVRETSERKLALTDIHDLEPAGSTNAISVSPLSLNSIFWTAHAVPLLLFIGLLGYRRLKDEKDSDEPQIRRQRAGRIAAGRLAKANALMQSGNAPAYYEAVSKALWLYLSDRLGVPISQLSKDATIAALAAKGISQTTLQKVIKLAEECEGALYSTSGGQQMTEVYRDTTAIITEIEAVLSK